MVTFKLCVSACACAWAQHPQPVQLIITLLLFACLYIFYLIFFFILLRNLFPAPWVVSHYGVKKNLCGICVDSTKVLTFLLRPLFLLSLPLLLLVFFYRCFSRVRSMVCGHCWWFMNNHWPSTAFHRRNHSSTSSITSCLSVN